MYPAEAKNKMITIREVAKLAGVSASTVSRVINGTAKVDSDKYGNILYNIYTWCSSASTKKKFRQRIQLQN